MVVQVGQVKSFRKAQVERSNNKTAMIFINPNTPLS